MIQPAADGSIILTAATPELGMSQAAALLGLPEGRIDLEVLQPGRSKRWFRPGRPYRFRAAPAPTEDRDGWFTLEYCGGATRLTVHPSSGRGRRVQMIDVEAGLASSPIGTLDHRALQAAVALAAGQPVVVGGIQPASDPAAAFQVVVSPDRMAAYLVAGEAMDESRPALEDVQRVLAANGVVCGIDGQVVASFAASTQSGEVHLVARGLPAERGADAEVCEVAPVGRGQPHPRVGDDGRSDFYSLGVIRTVPAGMLLLLKTPSGPGEPGFTVLGETLAAIPGDDVDLVRLGGRGTRCSADGARLLAGISGATTRIAGKLCVLPIQRITHDVDFSTGNIDFLGTVVVDGGIKSGFQVRAAGDIHVVGAMEAATLIAGGKVVLRSGIFGRGNGSIVAGGDVLAGFIEASTVRASGEVRVSGEILHSSIDAGGSVTVTGAGAIIGGRITSGGQVSAKAVGSPAGIRTAITLITAPGGESEEAPYVGAERTRPLVRVSGRVYPPAQITIGRARLRVRTITQYSTFFESGGRVGLLPYY